MRLWRVGVSDGITQTVCGVSGRQKTGPRPRPGPGGRHEQVELAAAVGAGAAKALAERVLSRAESGRVRRTVSLPQSGLAVKPGDGVRIAGEAGRWRVVAASCEGWATILELTPVEQAGEFWRAEEYHQDFYRKNPVRYTYYKTGCGRDARLKELWGRPGD